MPHDYKGNSELIWQPDTQVRSFPSGLLTVTRSAICRKSFLTQARQQVALGDPLPCNAPAIDGVYMFPTAEERDMGNGFAQIIATGYGRANTIGRETSIQIQAPFAFIGDTSSTAIFPLTLTTRQYVVLDSESLPVIADRYEVRTVGDFAFTLTLAAVIGVTDYGRFREIEIKEEIKK